MDRFDRDAETLVKRYKKADLAKIIAAENRAAYEREKNLREANHKAQETWSSCNKYAKEMETELDNLHLISRAVRSVLIRRGLLVSDKQLSIILSKVTSGYTPKGRQDHADDLVKEKKVPGVLVNAVTVIMDLLDACAEKDPFDGGPSYDDLRDMLDLALGDRAEMLAHLGMTDREWSARGGSCEADFDY